MSVAKKTIKMGLGVDSIDAAIAEIKVFQNDLARKESELLRRLGEIGVKEASVRFTTAMYDGVNDSSVSLEANSKGYAIVAEGRAVAFIEFGAGVYHNPGEPYPNKRPAGIVGIGQYGSGKGKRNAWGFRNTDGGITITHGNPAAMPMWYAREEMRSKILKIAQEVFG